MNDRQRDVALFRYSLIREAADPALSKRERGELVRELASRDHAGPGGRRVRVARNTIDRWIRTYRVGGFEALAPNARNCGNVNPGWPHRAHLFWPHRQRRCSRGSWRVEGRG